MSNYDDIVYAPIKGKQDVFELDLTSALIPYWYLWFSDHCSNLSSLSSGYSGKGYVVLCDSVLLKCYKPTMIISDINYDYTFGWHDAKRIGNIEQSKCIWFRYFSGNAMDVEHQIDNKILISNKNKILHLHQRYLNGEDVYS